MYEANDVRGELNLGLSRGTDAIEHLRLPSRVVHRKGKCVLNACGSSLEP